MNSNPHLPGGDNIETVVYDFGSYDEAVAAIRLLEQNGFAGADFRLTAKEPRGGLGAALARLVAAGARKARLPWPSRHGGSQLLIMHGKRSVATRAHGVLVERTNAAIQECLRFRQDVAAAQSGTPEPHGMLDQPRS